MSTNPNSRRNRTMIAFLAGFAALGVAAGAQAADYCEFYQHSNFNGSSRMFGLPSAASNGYSAWWGSTSTRRSGENLGNSYYSNIYNQASSIIVRAVDSDVVLYSYTGDHFDGTAFVMRCEQGYICSASSLGWMNDQLGSFNCQREFEVSEDDPTAALAIPTKPIATPIRASLDEGLAESDMVEEHFMEETRVRWTTAHERCTEWGIGCTGSTWRRRYADELHLTQNFEIDPEWWAYNYDIDVDMWVVPMRDSDGSFRLEETYYSLWVEDGVLDGIILESVEGDVLPLFDGDSDLGDQLTGAIEAEVSAAAAVVLTDLFGPGGLSLLDATVDVILGDVQRIQMTHSCDVWEQYIPESGIGLAWYTAVNPCLYGVPTEAFAPVIQFHHDR